MKNKQVLIIKEKEILIGILNRNQIDHNKLLCETDKSPRLFNHSLGAPEDSLVFNKVSF